MLISFATRVRRAVIPASAELNAAASPRNRAPSAKPNSLAARSLSASELDVASNTEESTRIFAATPRQRLVSARLAPAIRPAASQLPERRPEGPDLA